MRTPITIIVVVSFFLSQIRCGILYSAPVSLLFPGFPLLCSEARSNSLSFGWSELWTAWWLIGTNVRIPLLRRWSPGASPPDTSNTCSGLSGAYTLNYREFLDITKLLGSKWTLLPLPADPIAVHVLSFTPYDDNFLVVISRIRCTLIFAVSLFTL